MKPKAFNFYLDYDENIEALTDEEVGRLIRSLLSYAKTDEVPEMSPIVKVAFTPMRKQMDVEFANFEAKAQALSEAGKRGAEKRWQMSSNGITNKGEAIANNSHPVTSDSHPIENDNENDNKNKKESKKKATRESTLMFERFWNVYPKKVAKQTALKSFLKLKVTEELLQKMITALEQQIKSEQWQDAQYIPNPSTWLNQERWNDELPKAKTKVYGDYIQREPKPNPRFGMEYLLERDDEE